MLISAEIVRNEIKCASAVGITFVQMHVLRVIKDYNRIGIYVLTTYVRLFKIVI